jgi:hypothetical protein
MGTMIFRLPDGLAAESVQELEFAALAGGPDGMPLPSQLDLHPHQVVLHRDEDDSCILLAPWSLSSVGRLMFSSATLMDRNQPYDLLLELARGKVNQVRNQSADWQLGGLAMPESLADRIRTNAIQFGRLVCTQEQYPLNELHSSLMESCRLASELATLYRDQVFSIRHQRQAKLETSLGCRADASLFEPGFAAGFRSTFNRALLPLSWHTIESDETVYRWDQADALLDWIEANDLDVTAGPLIDFSAANLPAWLWLWERDVPSMATFMCRFVESAIRRYRSRIRRWHLTAGSNWATVLGLSEEDLLALTYRLYETARNVDPSLELYVGISQPWGEYRHSFDRNTPFHFADSLIRSGLQLSGLDLEVIMGVQSRGSYCRDELELSRLLDVYAILGVPLSVTFGYPAQPNTDPNSDPELMPGRGHWQSGHNEAAQANWTSRLAALALCKPYVRAVNWCHFSDGVPHTFPHCGLVDASGRGRPAREVLQKLRETHLR